MFKVKKKDVNIVQYIFMVLSSAARAFLYCGLYTMRRGLHGNGVRHKASQCVAPGRSVTPPECGQTA